MEGIKDIAAIPLPASAYAKVHFPTSLENFSGAVARIVEGWNAVVGQ